MLAHCSIWLLLRLVALAPAAGGAQQPSATSSELAFEYANLIEVPSGQLCALLLDRRRNQPSPTELNALSLAHNQIRRIPASAFECQQQASDQPNVQLGAKLKMLDLSHNEIELLALGAFKSLGQLHVLLLHSNRLKEIGADFFRFLGADNLRHLSLASNLIEQVAEMGPSASLISLDLRANPIERVARRAFNQLARLKTLQLDPLEGPGELRFLHLDRGRNLSSLSSDFCAHVDQLTSLTLRSNQYEQVPQLTNCHALLLIDLSYNHIGRISGHVFRAQAKLVDLYLAFNRIETIDQFAFSGLESLQVLQLNDNKLKSVHQNAFLPLGRSLLELNIGNNQQLEQLPARGLEQLSSLKCYGNKRLLELPRFQSAVSLVLTFAHHCCDYQQQRLLPSSYTNHSEQMQFQSQENFFVLDDGDDAPALRRKLKQADEQLDEFILWPRETNESDGRFLIGSRQRRHIATTNQLMIDDEQVAARVIWRQFARLRAEYSVGGDGESAPIERLLARQLERAIFGTQMAAAARRRRHAQEAPAPRAGRSQVVACSPQPNSFLPCADLFDSWWLRAAIWSVCLASFVGNALVIIVLCSLRQSSSTASALTSIMWFQGAHSKHFIDVPRLLTINLAIADLLMSLYLAILAAVDLTTMGRFRSAAIRWQHSFGCKLAGFLAIMSSELSVFILALITLERNYAITNAVHLNRRLSLPKACLLIMAGYLFAILMALAPMLNGLNDYKKYSICLPIEFTTQTLADYNHQLKLISPHGSSSKLYLIILLATNTLSFVLLFACYLRMYCAIRGSQAWNTNDLRIAKRMSILVLTDFLCWMPLIGISLSSVLFGRQLVPLEGVKWLIVFVLPLNSLANPFLYAITTKKFKRELVRMRHRLALVAHSVAGKLTTSCLCGRLEIGHKRHKPSIDTLASSVKLAPAHRSRCANRINSSRRQLAVGGPTYLDKGKLHIHEQYRGDELRRHQRPKRQTTTTADRQLQVVRVHAGEQHELECPRCHCQQQLATTFMRTNRNDPSQVDELRLSERLTIDSIDRRAQRRRREQTAASSISRHQQSLSGGGASRQQQRYAQAARSTGRPKVVLAELIEPSVGIALGSIGLETTTTSSANNCDHDNSTLGPRTHLVAANSITNFTQQAATFGLSSERLADSRHELARDEENLNVRRQPQSFRTIIVTMNSSASETDIDEPHEDPEAPAGDESALHQRSNRQPQIRCASACPYAERSNQRLVVGGQHVPARHQQIEAARSCDLTATFGSSRPMQSITPKTRTTADGELEPKKSASSSIQQLIFGSVARAWSSIQSFAGLTQAPPGLHPRSSAKQSMQKSLSSNFFSSSHPNQRDSDDLRQTSDSDRDDEQEDEDDEVGTEREHQAIIDDILLQGDWTKQSFAQFRDRRRMSRSCDNVILTYEAPSSGSGHWQMSGGESSASPQTSSADCYDDDRRILLATMNRLTVATRLSNNSRGSSSNASGSNKRQLKLPKKKRRSNNSARCRSWSPALLGKLEGCMQQLKSKISNLNHPELHSSTPRSATPDRVGDRCAAPACCADVVGLHQVGADEENPQDFIEVPRVAGLSRCGSPISDQDGDEFGEENLNASEWMRRMEDKSKKRPRAGPSSGQRRAKFKSEKRQTSTTSDSLSIKTVGTTLTSVSASFDSSTNLHSGDADPLTSQVILPNAAQKTAHQSSNVDSGDQCDS